MCCTTGCCARRWSASPKAATRKDLSYVGHLRGYQDITESSNIDLGFSYSQGHNKAGILNDVDVGRFKTKLYGFDATFRWRPLQRSIYHSFIGRTELIWSRRDQFDALQKAMGYYVSGDYQFGRRWFAGFSTRLHRGLAPIRSSAA